MPDPDHTRWDDMEAWLEQSEMLGPEERRDALQALTASDPELAAQLARFGDQRAEAWFDTLFGQLADAGQPVSNPEPAVPKRMAHFEILGVLGRGGMGIVYRARDTLLDRTVALKCLPEELVRDPTSRDRFLREARTAGQLDHPNICPVYEAGTSGNGVPYIAMPCYEGRTLRELIASGSLSPEDGMGLLKQVADGLCAAHENGVVHRDIKPSNILVTDEGIAKILDFGIARFVEGVSITAPEGRMGTVSYMSPEQVTGGPVDARSDIWSLGVVLYELLAGRRPFEASRNEAVLYAIGHSAPAELPAGTHPEWGALALNCLSRSRDERPQSCQDLLLRLGKGDAATRNQPALTWPVLVIITLVLVALAWQSGRGWPFTSGATRLAVLPFQNASQASTPSLLVQGLNADLINRMGRIPGLEVVRGRSIQSSEVAEYAELINADYLLWGQVDGDGENLVVDVRMLLPPDSIPVWTASFERPGSGSSNVQDEISSGVARELGLTTEESAGLAVQREAEDAYLSAITRVRRRTPRDLAEAIRLFEQAVSLEPEFSDAWGGLAHARMLSGGTAYYSALATSYGLARTAAERAISQDGSQALALTTLAAIASEFEWDTLRADSLFQVSIESNPNLAETHHLFASHLAESGRLDRALELQWHAMQLEPEALIHPTNYGQLLFYDRRHVEALRYLDDVIGRAPSFYVAHLTRSYPLMALGRYDEAIASLDRAEAITGPQHVVQALKASAHAMAGRDRQARESLSALIQESDSTYVPPPLIAQVYLALADTSRALDYLEDGLRAHDVYLTVIGPWPFSDALRDSPRFERVLELMDRDHGEF